MAATKEFARLENSVGQLSLTVPKEEIGEKYQKMLNEYAKNMTLPGFRKGKVPREVIERKFGAPLKEELKGRLVEDAIKEAFEDENFKGSLPLSYSTPEMKEDPRLDFDGDFSFTVFYDVYPEVRLGKWQGLEIQAPWAEVTEEDISRELEEVRETNSYVTDKPEGAQAENGDVVKADYTVWDAASGKEQDAREGFTFTLGAGTSYYEFDQEIAGMKEGEAREFEKTYEEGGPFPKAFEGKTLKFKVAVTSIKEKHLPALDDELAQDVSEKFSTLEDLKADIRGKLQSALESRLSEAKLEALLDAIKQTAQIDMPESMIHAEVGRQWYSMLRSSGADRNTAEELMRIGEENLGTLARDEGVRGQVESRLRSRLVMEAISAERKVEVGEDEITAAIEKEAGGRDAQGLREQFEKSGSMAGFVKSLEHEKLAAMLLAENNFTRGEKRGYLDFMGKIG